MLPLALVAVGALLTGGAAVTKQRRAAGVGGGAPGVQPQPPATPPPAAAPVVQLAPARQPAAQKGGEGFGETLLKVGSQVLGGGPLVAVGLKAAELERHVVGALGGNEATKAAVGILGPPATVGFLAQQATKGVLNAVGVKGDLAKGIEQVVGITAGAGVLMPVALPSIAAAKLVGEGVSALVGVIGGKQAEKDLRNAVSELDPFREGSVVSNVAKGIANAIFGPPHAPPASAGQLRPLTAEEQAAANAAAEKVAKQKAVAEDTRELAMERKRGAR